MALAVLSTSQRLGAATGWLAHAEVNEGASRRPSNDVGGGRGRALDLRGGLLAGAIGRERPGTETTSWMVYGGHSIWLWVKTNGTILGSVNSPPILVYSGDWDVTRAGCAKLRSTGRSAERHSHIWDHS